MSAAPASLRAAWTRMLVLVLLAVVPVGCGDSSASESPENERTPLQLILVYDRSTSITAEELAMYERLAAQKLETLGHEDRVSAIELLQLSLDETPNRWSQEVPGREFENRELQRDSVTLSRFLRDARDYLRRYTDPEGRDNYLGTDIHSTMFDVAADVQAFPNHRTTIVIFSDMLQATDEINMEGLQRMPPDDWIADRAAEGRLPDLGGACVVVVGARTDTAPGQRVKSFWEEYFEATGATLLGTNYSYRPVKIPERPCPGS